MDLINFEINLNSNILRKELLIWNQNHFSSSFKWLSLRVRHKPDGLSFQICCIKFGLFDWREVLKFWETTEAVAQTCSVKKVLLEISQNSQENTCAKVSVLIKLEASSRAPPVAASEIYGLYIFRKKIHKHMYIICLVYLISSLREKCPNME